MLSVSCTVPFGFVVILISRRLNEGLRSSPAIRHRELVACVDLELPVTPGPVLLAEMLAPFANEVELPAVILILPPVAWLAVLFTVPALLLIVLPALILIEPPAPAPVVEAVISPPLFTCT